MELIEKEAGDDTGLRGGLGLVLFCRIMRKKPDAFRLRELPVHTRAVIEYQRIPTWTLLTSRLRTAALSSCDSSNHARERATTIGRIAGFKSYVRLLGPETCVQNPSEVRMNSTVFRWLK